MLGQHLREWMVARLPCCVLWWWSLWSAVLKVSQTCSQGLIAGWPSAKPPFSRLQVVIAAAIAQELDGRPQFETRINPNFGKPKTLVRVAAATTCV